MNSSNYKNVSFLKFLEGVLLCNGENINIITS